MERPSKDEYYLAIAHEIAQRGTCLRRKVGAVIVKNDAILSTGYAGSPRGMENCIDTGKCFRKEAGIPSGQRYELCRSVHAEENAIINAARNGSNIFEGIMYLSDEKNLSLYNQSSSNKQESYGPCIICMKAIINSGLEGMVVKSANGIVNLGIEDIKKLLLEEESLMIKNEN